jgi:hypothetical protein
MRSMADDEAKNGGTSEAARRRRVPPPTIDLQATEVSPPTAPTEAAAPDPAQPDPAVTEAAPAEVTATESAVTEVAATEEAATAAAATETAASAPDGTSAAESSASSAAEPQAAESAAPPPRTGPPWAHLATGALGAILALLVAGGVWAVLGSGGEPPGTPQADLNARLARIESQLGTLSRAAPAPAQPAADTKALGDLTQRLARIESTLSERLAAVDREIKPLNDRIADLGRRDEASVAAARLAHERADAVAKSLAELNQQVSQLNAARANAAAVERSDLDALATRLASLEASTKQIGDQLALIASATNPGNTRQAVVALALNAAVERGAPYRRELAALDATRAGQGTVDALEPFAESGLPTAAVLSRELAAIMPEALKAAAAPAPGGGFLERLQSNAERLVRIRPIAQQPQPGDEPRAVLSRIEAKTTHGDIAGALAEAAKLPAAARAPLEPWIKRAAAREAALAVAAGLAAHSLDVIRRPAPGGPEK